MVGKMNSCELDMFEELKAVEKMNLFAIFPIGTTMQDGGKRKKKQWLATVCLDSNILFLFSFIFIYFS